MDVTGGGSAIGGLKFHVLKQPAIDRIRDVS
jgi:hypothetical protein